MNVVNDETETKLEYGNDESVENMEEVNNQIIKIFLPLK